MILVALIFAKVLSFCPDTHFIDKQSANSNLEFKKSVLLINDWLTHEMLAPVSIKANVFVLIIDI